MCAGGCRGGGGGLPKPHHCLPQHSHPCCADQARHTPSTDVPNAMGIYGCGRTLIKFPVPFPFPSKPCQLLAPSLLSPSACMHSCADILWAQAIELSATRLPCHSACSEEQCLHSGKNTFICSLWERKDRARPS